MDTTIETVHSSLAQRIAKVRNCMFVEVATGISPTNKELFVALCQSYEQQSVVTSCLTDELQESLLHWIASISNLPEETAEPRWPISILSRSFLSSRGGTGFLVPNWNAGPGFSDFADFADAPNYSGWDSTVQSQIL